MYHLWLRRHFQLPAAMIEEGEREQILRSKWRTRPRDEDTRTANKAGKRSYAKTTS